MAAIFDALQEGVLDSMPKNEPDWMCHDWINIASDPPELDV